MRRSHPFSFGAVLYATTCGHAAFAGTTLCEVFRDIMRKAPVPIHDLNGNVPGEWERVIIKFLQKDPTLRYCHASKIRCGSRERLRRDQAQMLGLLRRRTARRLIPLALAVLCVSGLAYLAVKPMQPPTASGHFRLSIDGRTRAEALGPIVTDGHSIYLVEGSGSLPMIAQVSITGGETKTLPTPLGLPELLDISRSKALGIRPPRPSFR